MTLSSTQDSVFDPSDMSGSDFNRVDVSISQDGTWIAMGTPAHGLDEDGLNLLAEAGACYLFKRANKVYSQKQKLIDSNRLVNSEFGSRVWMSAYGRRLFIASKNDSNTISGGGSVSIYDLDETNDVWILKLKLELSTPISGAKFGWSIMSDFYGQLLVVGSPFEANGGTLRGAGYLFKDNGTTFNQLNKFSYSKDLDNSRLGYSVAISGDGNVVFMGMTLSDLSGSVAVFKKNNAGIFPSIENSIVRDIDGLANDYFSVAIETLGSIAGNSLVVDHEGRNLYIGAHNKLDSSGIRGVVFRFTGDKDYNYSFKEIILQRKGKNLDLETLSSKFGFYISTDKFGKVLLVGAKDDGEIQSGSGALYVYKRDTSLNTYAIKVGKNSPLVDDHDGNSVAISNNGSSFISGSTVSIAAPPPPLSYNDTILVDSPIAYWRMGDSSGPVTDEIGGRDGGDVNGITFGADSLLVNDLDTSCNFVSSQYAVVPDDNIFSFTDGVNDKPFSFEALIKISSLAAHRPILSKSRLVASVTNEYIFEVRSSGELECILYTGTSANNHIFKSPPNSILIDTIYHVVSTYTGVQDSGLLYINGSPVSVTYTESGTYTKMQNTATDLHLAIRFVLESEPTRAKFNGDLDEVAMYDYVLTPARVLVHAQAAGF